MIKTNENCIHDACCPDCKIIQSNKLLKEAKRLIDTQLMSHGEIVSEDFVMFCHDLCKYFEE